MTCFELSIKIIIVILIYILSLGIPLFLPIVLLFQPPQTYTTNFTHTEALYEQLVTGYNRDLFPRETAEHPVNIQMTVRLLSINHFDEISGILKMIVQFDLEWQDFRIKWRPSDFGGIESFQIPSSSVWKPALYLRESALKYEPIGNSYTGNVRIAQNGSISWSPGEIVYSSCSVDVLNFPFDEQTCNLNFIPLTTLATEVVLQSTGSEIELHRYLENSQWELIGNAANTANMGGKDGEISALILKLVLKRRNLFYVYYILCPLFFLAFLNKLVFFMLPDSGERTGVAVTIFLSFVVYMDVINANVPASSNPVAFIYIVILLLMMYSVMIMLMCIVSSRIYIKTTEVPVWVQKTVKFLRFGWLRNRKISIIDNDPTMKEISRTHPDKTTDLDHPGKQDMSWAVVGKTVDIYCYIACALFLVIGLILALQRIAN